jgi:hypothetical protein
MIFSMEQGKARRRLAVGVGPPTHQPGQSMATNHEQHVQEDDRGASRLPRCSPQDAAQQAHKARQVRALQRRRRHAPATRLRTACCVGTSTLPPRCPHFFSEDSWSSKCTAERQERGRGLGLVVVVGERSGTRTWVRRRAGFAGGPMSKAQRAHSGTRLSAHKTHAQAQRQR